MASSGRHAYAPTKLEDEKIELRAQMCSNTKKEDILSGYPLLCMRARDGDRTRDPLLGKEVLHR